MRAWPLAAVLVVVACSTGASPTMPTAPTAPTAPAHTQPSTTAQPVATATERPASPTPHADPLAPGEPWLLHTRYVSESVKRIFLVRPDGTNDHQILTNLPGDMRAVSWSTDGSRIAFVYLGPGSTPDGEIWTAAADGSGAAKLLDGSPECTGAFYPAWSPDDKKLSFVCYKDDDSGGTSGLALFDFATGKITHLNELIYPEVLDNPHRWSPDGSTIVFDILHWDPTDQFLDGSLIATIPTSGGDATRLTSFDSFAAHPDWRPDGNQLVFNTYDLGNMVRTPNASNLLSIRPDGTALNQITTASVDGAYRITQARWDPSGDRIWVTIWQPSLDVSTISIGRVDPSTGAVSDLGIEGNGPQPRPVPRSGQRSLAH